MNNIRIAALTLGLLGMGASAMSAEKITYSYDGKGRIVKVVRTGTVNNNVTVDYEHDKADNRPHDRRAQPHRERGSASFAYDGPGNLTSDGTNAYSYTSENLLNTGPGSATLGYDPLGRLYQSVGGG